MAFTNKPAAPFLWGRGGRRLSSDAIDMQRRLAAQQMAAGSDFSPLGHWTQGLARVANSVVGGIQMNRADRAAEERQAAQEQSIAALLADYDPASGEPDPVVAALADPELRQLGMSVLEARRPEQVEPVIRQRNDGSFIGLHPVTGEIMFEQADPNPKPVLDWLMADDPVTGEKRLIPVGPGGPLMGGGDPASGAAGAMPPATLPPDFDFGEPSDQDGGRILQNALQTRAISRADADRVLRSFGPNGQAEFNAWLRTNNVRVTD